MPVIKSAKKRAKQADKARERNSVVRQTLRKALKNFTTAVIAKKDVPGALSTAQSALDQAAKKGVMHKNKAARKKSQLAAKAKTVTIKSTSTKKAPVAKKKTVTKKTTK